MHGQAWAGIMTDSKDGWDYSDPKKRKWSECSESEEGISQGNYDGWNIHSEKLSDTKWKESHYKNITCSKMDIREGKKFLKKMLINLLKS